MQQRVTAERVEKPNAGVELARHTTDEMLRLIARLAETAEADIKIDDHLEGHLGLDVRERLNLAVLIDQKFAVRIPEDMMRELQLVGSLIAHVVSAVARMPAAERGPRIDLARVGLDAGWARHNGALELTVWPLGSERSFALRINGATDLEEAQALADNIARRLNLNSEILPQR